MEMQYYKASNAGRMKYFSLSYERNRQELYAYTCTIKALEGKYARQIGMVAVTPENYHELMQDFPVKDGSTLTFHLREGALSLERNHQALMPIPTPLSIMERKHVANAVAGGVILLVVGVLGAALSTAYLNLIESTNTFAIYGSIAEGIVYLVLGFLALRFWSWIATLLGTLLYIIDNVVWLVSVFSALSAASQMGATATLSGSFCFGIFLRIAVIIALIVSVVATKDLHDDRAYERRRIKTTPFALPGRNMTA